jgi:hypothetical protein
MSNDVMAVMTRTDMCCGDFGRGAMDTDTQAEPNSYEEKSGL